MNKLGVVRNISTSIRLMDHSSSSNAIKPPEYTGQKFEGTPTAEEMAKIQVYYHEHPAEKVIGKPMVHLIHDVRLSPVYDGVAKKLGYKSKNGFQTIGVDD